MLGVGILVLDGFEVPVAVGAAVGWLAVGERPPPEPDGATGELLGDAVAPCEIVGAKDVVGRDVGLSFAAVGDKLGTDAVPGRPVGAGDVVGVVPVGAALAVGGRAGAGVGP